MDTRSEAPAATVAIVTRDRKDELRNALSSALAQEGSIEVVVIDDGSQDGTAAMVREEFPQVRLVRFEEPAGIAARRNDATDAARANVIVEIDDDAVFSSNDIVRHTLRELDHPRVGVVAIPYVDVGTSLAEQQRAPDREDRWVTSVFRSTACALRRDALIQVGGWSSGNLPPRRGVGSVAEAPRRRLRHSLGSSFPDSPSDVSTPGSQKDGHLRKAKRAADLVDLLSRAVERRVHDRVHGDGNPVGYQGKASKGHDRGHPRWLPRLLWRAQKADPPRRFQVRSTCASPGSDSTRGG